MRRGNRKQDIYCGDVGCQEFLHTVVGACQETGFQGVAFCPVQNLFHLNWSEGDLGQHLKHPWRS